MRDAGIPQSDWHFADLVIQNESGWWPTKWNGQYGFCPETPTERPANSSGAYGLGQALGAEKMAPFGDDWKTNPVTQLRWAAAYALGRYSTWEAAWTFKQCVGWCHNPKTGWSGVKSHSWW